MFSINNARAAGVKRNDECDVVIVGLGAAGGLAASLLAGAGRQVVGLDAGDWHGVEEYALDDLRQLGLNDLGSAKVNHEVPTVRSQSRVEAVQPLSHLGNLMMNGVGGSKIHSTNISWRLLPWNFRTRSETLSRYGREALPAESTVVDWPLDYSELEPYYALVEKRYRISGVAGNLAGRSTGRGNPFEGPRSSPYPAPPLRRSGWNNLMAVSANGLGWNPFETPASIQSQSDDHGPGCQYCGFCTWNGCWADAKGVPSSRGLPEAQASGNLEVRTGARALRITTGDGGRASGVDYIRDGEIWHQPARLILLATYTYENTRLLLLSSSPTGSSGLANDNGQVGRHFMTHTFVMTFGHFPRREINAWSGTAAQATAIDDFDGDNFNHEGLGFIGGGVLMACQEFRLLLHHHLIPAGVPRWGHERKRWLADNFRSIGWAYTLPDGLSYADEKLDLDPKVRDRDGIPVIRVTYRLRPNEERQSRFLNQRMNEWFQAAGAAQVWHTEPAASPISTHAYGGTRMGDDPTTSVVDRWGLAHTVPNLAVLGASTFPTAGGVNPTETVEALTWRSVDHILNNWDQIAT